MNLLKFGFDYFGLGRNLIVIKTTIVNFPEMEFMKRPLS